MTKSYKRSNIMKYNLMAIAIGIALGLLSIFILVSTRPQCRENEKPILSYGLNGWACARRP
jgi:hypothetical protein